MGFLNTKIVDASAYDAAKAVRKAVYDGKFKGGKKAFFKSFPQVAKSNGGIDTAKLADEFIKDFAPEGLLNNKGKLTDEGLQVVIGTLKELGLKTTATFKDIMGSFKRINRKF